MKIANHPFQFNERDKPKAYSVSMMTNFEWNFWDVYKAGLVVSDSCKFILLAN